MGNDSRSDLLPGTLELLVLKTLSLGELHGYAIAQYIQRLSRDVLQVEEGSLYPALQRLQLKGLIKSKWGHTPSRRRARYYTITALGRKQLGEETASYERVIAAMARVLKAQ